MVPREGACVGSLPLNGVKLKEPDNQVVLARR